MSNLDLDCAALRQEIDVLKQEILATTEFEHRMLLFRDVQTCFIELRQLIAQRQDTIRQRQWYYNRFQQPVEMLEN
jgi:hypothetical protein